MYLIIHNLSDGTYIPVSMHVLYMIMRMYLIPYLPVTHCPKPVFNPIQGNILTHTPCLVVSGKLAPKTLRNHSDLV